MEAGVGGILGWVVTCNCVREGSGPDSSVCRNVIVILTLQFNNEYT